MIAQQRSFILLAFLPLAGLIIYIVPLILFIFKSAEGISKVGPLINTKFGLIRGLAATDGDYSMFMGIPYAIVNSSNPFGASIPHPKFDGIFEANNDSAICPQIEEFNKTIVGSLDCLHVNIYVPNSANPKNLLPVLVWIYGGGFNIGFGGRYVYGPKYLVRHDIIFVTFNYRLGPYGFLCLDTPEVPGNQGLKDQLTALRWIYNNIESFGGNANNITIAGNSAGAISVDIHLLYTKEKLFNKAILESGTSLYTRTMMYEPDVTPPLKLAKHLGYETNDFTKALSFLAEIEPKKVIAAGSKINLEVKKVCVEKDFLNVEKFITDYPFNINTIKTKNISIMIGSNNDESIARYGNKDPEYYTYPEQQNRLYELVSYAFDFKYEELNQSKKIIDHFYFGDEKISYETKQNLIDFESDYEFIYPVQRSINKYLTSGAENLYQYLFSYISERGFVRNKDKIKYGKAAHADELGYLFDISYMSEPTTEDQLIIDRLTALWANFVKYGNPTPQTSELLPVKWKPTTKVNAYYLNIDTEMSIGRRAFNKRMAFWDLFYKCNEKYQKGYRNK